MSDEISVITVKIMGRDLSIKCPKSKIAELQQSAHHLENKMSEIFNNNKLLGFDKIALITAINIVHEHLFNSPKENPQATKRVVELTNKIKKLEIES